MVILGEDDLRRSPQSYAAYYDGHRTHLSLGKDAPAHRPIQRIGQLVASPILVGVIINIAGCSSRQGQGLPPEGRHAVSARIAGLRSRRRSMVIAQRRRERRLAQIPR